MGANYYHMFFDRSEPYRRYIYDRRYSKKARKHLPLLEKIIEIAEIDDMRCSPALQLADLYAWCVSQQDKTPNYKWQTKLLKQDRVSDLLDYPAMREKLIPGVTELVDGWNLPRKKPTI